MLKLKSKDITSYRNVKLYSSWILPYHLLLHHLIKSTVEHGPLNKQCVGRSRNVSNNHYSIVTIFVPFVP